MSESSAYNSVKPSWFFGLGLTRITVRKDEEGFVYLQASGTVNEKIKAKCEAASGRVMTITDALNFVRPELLDFYYNENKGK